MTCRSEDGGIYGHHHNPTPQLGSDEDDSDMREENEDQVDYQPQSTIPSVLLDHTPTSLRNGINGIMRFDRLPSQRDS